MKPKYIIPLKKYKHGYDVEEVVKFMKKQGRLKEWKKYSMGSTGCIDKGKYIVYTHDLERFLEGLPNDD